MSNKSSKSKPSDNGSVAVLEQPVGVAVLDVPAADESAVVISEGIEQLDSLSDLATLINDSPPAKALDAATQVENSIESFEQAFKGDPLATKYKAFGEEGKRLYDPADMAAEYVHLGAMGYNLMIDEKNVRPAAYDRARTVKKLESALRLCDVPESFCKPQEILAIFWVVRLDQSITPQNEGETRTFMGDISADWFGGNISTKALRSLARLISRASKKDETDVWEFVPGMEQFSRQMVRRLRNNEISVRQLDALIEHHKQRIEKERDELARSVMTAEQRKAADDKSASREHEAKHSRLRSLINAVQDYAVDDLKQSKEQLRDIMVAKGVIPPPPQLTVKAFAEIMTPGDAKGLVQSLVELYPTKPDRLLVLKALYSEVTNVVKQMKEAATQKSEQRKAG